jgi:predicted 2-oxoglutarate/Fe(II)-dependent dioxygenase YbiX
MIKVIPNFVSDDIITKVVSSIDMTKAENFPNQQNIKTINGIYCPPVYEKAKHFGKITSIEFLTYGENSKMFPHFDGYGFQGDHKWVHTGILFMNDPSEYEGGELLFNMFNMKMKCPKGTFVIFEAGPTSKLYTHSVNTVTKGKRQSLVLRYTGE